MFASKAKDSQKSQTPLLKPPGLNFQQWGPLIGFIRSRCTLLVEEGSDGVSVWGCFNGSLLHSPKGCQRSFCYTGLQHGPLDLTMKWWRAHPQAKRGHHEALHVGFALLAANLDCEVCRLTKSGRSEVAADPRYHWCSTCAGEGCENCSLPCGTCFVGSIKFINL